MAYTATSSATGRLERRRPGRFSRLAGAPELGDFDWGQFGTQLATTVGASVAGAGTALLSAKIQQIGQPKQVIPTAPPAGMTTLGGAAIPDTVLIYGGGAFVLLLLVVMLKR